MRLARAGSADEDDVAAVGHERAGVQRSDQALVDRRAVEHEGVQALPARGGLLGCGQFAQNAGGAGWPAKLLMTAVITLSRLLGAKSVEHPLHEMFRFASPPWVGTNGT